MFSTFGMLFLNLEKVWSASLPVLGEPNDDSECGPEVLTSMLQSEAFQLCSRDLDVLICFMWYCTLTGKHPRRGRACGEPTITKSYPVLSFDELSHLLKSETGFKLSTEAKAPHLKGGVLIFWGKVPKVVKLLYPRVEIAIKIMPSEMHHISVV